MNTRESAADGPLAETRSPASFRDPAGALFWLDGRVLRTVNRSGVKGLAAFLGSRTGQELAASGRVVSTRVLDGDASRELQPNPALQTLLERAEGRMLVEHERIPFPSFPYEWTAEMLHSAGELTLTLAKQLLPEGLGLKDATPHNVLFRGPQPVFIDLLSFECRDPFDPTWLPYAQFVRTFLLPLLANKYLGLPLDQILISRRDGVQPEEIYRWLSPLQKIRPLLLTLVSIPTWLAASRRFDNASIYRKRLLRNPEKARFILGSLLARLSRDLNRLAPVARNRSAWTDYMRSNAHYTKEHFAAKETFVRESIAEFRPKRVLDVGCNTGHFSLMAARSGAAVVAIDEDPSALAEVWRKARAERLDILPLRVNLARPSPAIGWRNEECPSFLDRGQGHFDAVMMLAVLHHLLVSERLPLPDVLELASELTTGLLIVEFISPQDPMFRRIARGRDELHSGLTSQVFEDTCRRRFEILRSRHFPGSSRWLYLLRKRK